MPPSSSIWVSFRSFDSAGTDAFSRLLHSRDNNFAIVCCFQNAIEIRDTSPVILFRFPLQFLALLLIVNYVNYGVEAPKNPWV